ncbi:unnamed protein product [Prorocentrum cordatum]|uniref:Uncharacterized protein n=1 Tax=Prorocentrum cordatum TaxID=2364126 RepID=A0ABN9T142_9DINO|nr:unnamed protein product [Polarella glacialis]
MSRRPRGPVPEEADVRVVPLVWGEPLSGSLGHVDWVLASDVTTLRGPVGALCDTMAQLLRRRRHAAPRVVLSHARRTDYDEQLDHFLAQAALRGLGAEVVSEELLHDESGLALEVSVLEVKPSVAIDSTKCGGCRLCRWRAGSSACRRTLGKMAPSFRTCSS